MGQTIQERISAALGTVINTRTGNSVLKAGMIRELGATPNGKVRLIMMLGPDDDATLVRDARQAIERVSGVTEVTIDVRDPRERPKSAPRTTSDRSLPVMDGRAASPRPSVAPPVTYPGLGNIIAVSSGKGGVGKSTVAVNLAAALAARGARVGLMDADVYGPNVPRMMGVSGAPQVVNEKIVPPEAHGVRLISLGFLIERDQPAIWRGPIVMKIVTQFLRDVNWGGLDYLIVDMPPGTGDAQLSLVQATQVKGAIIVTTPQDVATGDALRGAMMFLRVGVPVLGIVENMSWFECPHCGKPTPIFGSGGGQRLADELKLPLLAQVPFASRVLDGGDSGMPIVVADPASGAARALMALAEGIVAKH